MKEIIEKMAEQNILPEDYITMVKVIQASLQRGAIRPNEMITVGKLYDKLEFMIKKMEKEKSNA
tara:strand:- start:299 stop:490 length:192 start_codon:yes stop_codon:yes gene_type:complete